MQQHSTGYIIGFVTAVCFVCALVVASSAVGLKDRQRENQILDRQKKVLAVAGLMREGESIARDETRRRFGENVTAHVVDLDTGEIDESVDPETYDQQAAKKDPEQSTQAPPNRAKVRRLPDKALVYEVIKDGQINTIIIPIEGQGLWSTLYGYLALAPDTRTIKGITFYEQGETPGLGGEIDNPRWKAKWPGRKAYDENWKPAIGVKKGPAGPPDEDPYNVDGLSGATITSRSVGALVRFWLGDDGFGPFLKRIRSKT